MIRLGGLNALLDANVLYPAPVRDLLLRLAEADFFRPKWSEEIHEEWIRHLLQNREDLKRESLEGLKEAMNSAFPDATVSGYEEISQGLELPDVGDRHVLAAAIIGHVEIIITDNLKDFPKSVLNKYEIEALSADQFIVSLIGLEPQKCKQTFLEQVKSLRKPPQTPEQVLETFANCNLTASAQLLRDLL